MYLKYQQGRYAAALELSTTALSKFHTFADSPNVKELSAVRALYMAVHIHVPVFTRLSRANRNFSLPVAHAHVRILVQTRLFHLGQLLIILATLAFQALHIPYRAVRLGWCPMTCSRPMAFRTEVSILLKCSTALINKHPAGIFPPWNLALQMRMLASSAFLETQAVVSSFPYFSQTSARRLSLVRQLQNPCRTLII